MTMLKEFKDFATRGSVVDMAVGVIVGGAFGKIVDSLVADIIMPLIAVATGGMLNFSNAFIALAPVPEGVAMTLDSVKKAGIPVFAWGNFLTITLNFVILAFVIFIMVKQINKIRNVPQAAPAEDVLLLREIRDSLKK